MVQMTTAPTQAAPRGRIPIRDVELFVDVVGHGDPLVMMHGAPSTDHWTLQSFRQCADRFTLVFYDHRCNGRSQGPPVESMTFDNLTADADALRERLGFERWAVLGHSFGGHVALEYALRFPERVSRLVLLDTAGDAGWYATAGNRLAHAGCDPKKAELVRRWFSGDFRPREYFPSFMRIADAYSYDPSWRDALREIVHGGWRMRIRPEVLIFAHSHLLPGWTVMDRLGEITAPTLVMAGREDFLFPPQSQRELATGIPGAQLKLIDRAGHNPHDEQTDQVMREIRKFIASEPSA
jgi:proline iminopeptidase